MTRAGMRLPIPKLDIIIDHPVRSVDSLPLAKFIQSIVETEPAHLVALSIVLTHRERVHALNRQYLGHDYPTDVIAFPLGESRERAAIDGEVYVDLDTAFERHNEFGTTFEAEVARYVIHGVLHLIGYTDNTPEKKAVMREREDFYLRDES